MKTIYALVAMMLLTLAVYSQEWKANVFTGFNYSLDSNVLPESKITGKDKSKFEVKDVFVTFNSFKYEEFSASATLNYNEAEKFNLYSAEINFNKPINKTTTYGFTIGKLENIWYNKTNKYWSNYSIEKVATVKYNLLPQTDLGFTGYLHSKYFDFDANVSNANNDSSKSLTGVLSIYPVKGLSLKGVYYKFEDYKVFGGGINFQGENKKSGKVNVTGEFLLTDNTNWKSQLISVYSEIQPKVLGPISVVGKFDTYKPNKDSDYKENSLSVGLNYNYSIYGATGKIGFNFHNVSSTNSDSHNEVSLHANFNY